MSVTAQNKISSVVVRPAAADDLAAISHLMAETPLFREYGMTLEKAKEQITQAFNNTENLILIALVGQQMAGFVWFLPKGSFGRSGYLRLIAVSEDWQGKGVGKLLVREMEVRCLKPYGIFLMVTSTNKTGQQFYESLGYRKVAELPGYIKENFTECLYWKSAPKDA